MAKDAEQNLYNELGPLFKQLVDHKKSELVVAMRLTILPELVDLEMWHSYRVLLDCPNLEEVLLALCEAGILDASEPYPTFGHTSRLEAARTWWRVIAPIRFDQEAKSIAIELATRTDPENQDSFKYGVALAAISKAIPPKAPSALIRLLSACALTMLGADGVAIASPLIWLSRLAVDQVPSQVAHFVAMGIFNSLNEALSKRNNFKQQEMFENLRRLAELHPANAGVQEVFASVLVNVIGVAPMLDAASIERLSRELVEVVDRLPLNQKLLQLLATGIFNALNRGRDVEDIELIDKALARMRTLMSANPTSETIREKFAKGLVNALIDAQKRGNDERRELLLSEIRALAFKYPGDSNVRLNLAISTQLQVSRYDIDGPIESKYANLNTLRGLVQAHPEDDNLSEQFAIAIVSFLNAADSEQNNNDVQELVKDLRILLGNHRENAAIRQHFAHAVFRLLSSRFTNCSAGLREEVELDLSALLNDYPDDKNLRAINVLSKFRKSE